MPSLLLLSYLLLLTSLPLLESMCGGVRAAFTAVADFTVFDGLPAVEYVVYYL
jgi:hypothetical protein